MNKKFGLNRRIGQIAIVAILAAMPAGAQTYSAVPAAGLQQIVSNAVAQAVAQYQVEQAITAMSATNAAKAAAPSVAPAAPVVATPAAVVVVPVVPAGTNGPSPVAAPAPQSIQDVVGTMEAWLAANNPSLTNFYSDTELELQLGGVYSQATGEAGAKLDITDWGLLTKNVGFGGSIVEGNSGGQSGTAGAWAHLDYRRIIGNVSAKASLGGGYDTERDKAMAVPGGEVEYRWSQHLGAYAGAGYAFEGTKAKDRGLIVGGGLSYSF